jgi:proteasome accessory factor C
MLALLPYLRVREPVRLSMLAAATGATPEQVAEDLTLLTFCGVPPFSPYDMVDLTIDGDTVEVYLAPPALERPVRLSPVETRALAAALETAGHEPDDPLVTKLLESVSAPLDAEALMAVVRGGSAAGIRDTYDVLAEALEAAASLEIEYFTASSGRHSTRVVRPYALVNERGVWYLSAYCEVAGDVRTFRVDRIRSARATGEYFQKPAGVRGSVVPSGADLPNATLLLRAGAPFREERDWPGAILGMRADGDVEASVPYSSPSWVARRVAAGLGSIEALGPDEVRRAVCETAGTALRELG